MRLAAASEIGILNHTPLDPQNKGKIIRHGISISTCRLRERMMAFLAMPIFWKKLEVTI